MQRDPLVEGPSRDVPALDADQAPIAEPEPLYWWPRFDTDGAFAGEIIVGESDWARLATARLLVPSIAEHHGIPAADVIAALARVGANLAHLFDSPQGWVILGEYVGAVANGSTDLFKPTVQ